MNIDEMLCYFPHCAAVIYSYVIKPFNIIIYSHGRNAGFFYSFENIIDYILIVYCICKQYSAVEIIEIRKIKNIKFANIVTFIIHRSTK